MVASTPRYAHGAVRAVRVVAARAVPPEDAAKNKAAPPLLRSFTAPRAAAPASAAPKRAGLIPPSDTAAELEVVELLCTRLQIEPSKAVRVMDQMAHRRNPAKVAAQLDKLQGFIEPEDLARVVMASPAVLERDTVVLRVGVRA
jgi:hypothetical protein